jgi:alkylation response protein AidB-like acyl-CoA dehydrogenase
MEREPAFEDVMSSLQSVGRMPGGVLKETRDAVAMARKFNDAVVRPSALELDRRMQEDPTYLPWDFLKEANRCGFNTMWMPRFLGGKGRCVASLCPFMEELASADPAMGLLIGAQYFGFSILLATWNTRLISEIAKDVVEGERNGDPCLLCGAVTEPDAGTDVEEVELLSMARVGCQAVKVKGGYVVNGTKIFISSGHIATWTILICYEDIQRPDESIIILAVKKGTEGFSPGRMEDKMGCKASPTSELVFEDCFIPDRYVCYSSDQIGYLKRGPKDSGMQLIDFVVSLSRPGVGAFSAGIARCAYEHALEFARETKVDGKLLVNHEWVQCLLAEMYKNIALARMTYMECIYVNELYSPMRLLSMKPIYYGSKAVPASIFEKLTPGILEKESATRFARKFFMDGQRNEEAMRTSGWASLSKFAASDLAVRNCDLAIELMGQAGMRHDHRVEKCLRDVKLLQIGEGTNQLNRLNLFKCLIAGSVPEVEIFAD